MELDTVVGTEPDRRFLKREIARRRPVVAAEQYRMQLDRHKARG
jgi:hypothetical protein